PAAVRHPALCRDGDRQDPLGQGERRQVPRRPAPHRRQQTADARRRRPPDADRPRPARLPRAGPQQGLRRNLGPPRPGQRPTLPPRPAGTDRPGPRGGPGPLIRGPNRPSPRCVHGRLLHIDFFHSHLSSSKTISIKGVTRTSAASLKSTIHCISEPTPTTVRIGIFPPNAFDILENIITVEELDNLKPSGRRIRPQFPPADSRPKLTNTRTNRVISTLTLPPSR